MKHVTTFRFQGDLDRIGNLFFQHCRTFGVEMDITRDVEIIQPWRDENTHRQGGTRPKRLC